MLSALALVLALTACDVALNVGTIPPSTPAPIATATAPLPSPEQAARTFGQVVQAVVPVATRECNRRTRGINCDFLITIDPDRNAPPNAYQSLDETGRPVLTFTAALIASIRNPDEMAFVMGHEASHHIANHLARQSAYAAAGAEAFGTLATLTGGGARDVAAARELGAAVGARSYSKEFELEADRLGTIITYKAGFDPLVGAAFFTRIPDPGDQFLGSHPPNAQRLEAVRRTVRAIGG